MLQKLRKTVGKLLVNIPGWRTDRKIVVFESDDWGSIRMPSKKALHSLIKKGYPLHKCVYSSNDALETNKDLEYLLDVLNSVKDVKGKPAIFTINNIVSNPDFKKIRDSNFQKYYYQSFVESLKERPNSDEVMNLYYKGIEEKLLKPQFHGREHVHIDHWMRALRDGDKELHEVFNEGMFTYYKGDQSNCKREFLDAMGTYNEKQFHHVEEKIKDGLDLFKKIWGYKSKTVIAPCYIWSRDIERFFHKYGIRLIQSGHCQKEPVVDRKRYKVLRRYTGQKNKYNQTYSVRNVYFEPASNPDIDWIDKALDEISTSFLWKKPAIISSHRVNFIGSINQKNRDDNIKLLEVLLNNIVKEWPEVEFMSSDLLADLIQKN